MLALFFASQLVPARSIRTTKTKLTRSYRSLLKFVIRPVSAGQRNDKHGSAALVRGDDGNIVHGQDDVDGLLTCQGF